MPKFLEISRRVRQIRGEYLFAAGFFAVYAAFSLMGGLGFERDTYSHVTLMQEIIGYRVYLPFFGREYVWLPGFHYFGAFFSLLSEQLVAPVYVARFISAASSCLVIFIVYRWLRELGVGVLWRIVGVLSVGLNAYWFAYSSMSMTDTFSILLLVGWLYFLDKYLKSGKNKNLALAAVLAFGNVATRYEAWIFMAASTLFLFAWSNRPLGFVAGLKKKMVSCTVFAVPSAAFIGFWLLYCFVGTGDPLYFTHDPTKFLWGNSLYYHSLGGTIQELLGNLLLVSGVLWIFPFAQAWKGKSRGLFLQFSLLISVYLPFMALQLYSGVNAGFVRYWLPILPLSVTALP
jgi:hypothetical protein